MGKSLRDRKPKSVSGTPIRDWVCAQPRIFRASLVLGGSLLLACGGLAGFQTDLSPVPINQQFFFAVLLGLLLGSRLSAVSAALYLATVSVFHCGWPYGAGPTPMTGSMAGYLWVLPLVCYSSGYMVARLEMEAPSIFAMGAALSVGLYHAAGTVRLVLIPGVSGAEAALKAGGLVGGIHAFQAALAVALANSCGTFLHAARNR